jgi:beta-lactamase class A
MAEKLYDISYLWHHDIKSVLAYREQVGSILGKDVARRLKVVSRGDLFGLIYHRRGGSEGVVRVANTHTRLLKSQGLEAAAPVVSTDWHFFGDKQTVASSQNGPAVSNRSKMTKRQRAQEIRNLEAAIEDYITELRHNGKLAADERTGWSVYDFTTGEKLVTINEDTQFQAASLVKPFIAAAFFQKVADKELIYGPKSRRHMVRMIQHSNNRSTNWVIRQVGGPAAVQKILKDHYPGIFQDTLLVEYIPAGGRTYKNKASIHDYSRFLYALWTEEIPGAREIKRLMALPGSDRIYTGAEAVPKGTKVYNKTGSTARVCGDMGILNIKGPNGKRYPYTIIGIIEKQSKAENYTAWIRSRSDVIRNVSNIVYKGIARHHELNGLL